MIFSIIALLNSFWATTPQTISAKTISTKFHAVSKKIPRKIYLRRFKSSGQPKSREILKRKISKPWDGHFSAKNFRTTQADQNNLKKIKENLKTSILALPGWHTRALKDLEVKKENNISRGLSSSSKMRLHTSSIQNSEELIAVFIHEMGHITDLGALKGRNNIRTKFYDGKTPTFSDDSSFKFYQISWENSYQQKKSAKKSDFVSGYSQSDVFEDFAETYAFYRLHGEKFRGILHNSFALKRKYEFMKKYVFNGQEFQLSKLNNYNFNYQNVFDVTLLNFKKQDL